MCNARLWRSTLHSFLTFIALSLVATAIAAPRYAHEGPILVSNTTIIDGLGHRPNHMRDILIQEGRIVQIAAHGFISDLPDNIKVIDGAGTTTLPGLIDLHTHFENVSFDWDEYRSFDDENTQRTFNAFLYAGVTTVLNIGDPLERVVKQRDQIAAGERFGPTVVAVGDIIHRLPAVTGTGNMPSDEVRAEIEALLDAREDAGIDIVKIYGGITPWGARHLVKAAHERGMRVVADFWCTNMSRTVFEITRIDAYAHGGCRELTQEEAEWVVENDKFVMMTLAAFDIMGGHLAYADYQGERNYYRNDLITGPFGKQIANDYYDTFSEKRQTIYEGENSFFQANLFGDLTHLLPDGQKSVRKLVDAGALVGLGTDANWPPGTFPGDSLHHEMLLHEQAGLDPVEVIKLATFNGARILEMDDEIGSVERGKVADLLIVRGNPAEDINDTRNIVHVIQDGKLIDRKSLRRGQ